MNVVYQKRDEEGSDIADSSDEDELMEFLSEESDEEEVSVDEVNPVSGNSSDSSLVNKEYNGIGKVAGYQLYLVTLYRTYYFLSL